MMDIKQIRNDFPVLKRKINGKSLVYLDSAATSQKPRQVIEAIVDYYQNYNANVHRGIHTLGDESTKMYDSARQTVAEFIGASDKKELIFVRNTTEAINLVAHAWGRNNIKTGDEILVSEMEHHSNIVPWQVLAGEKGAVVKFIDVTSEGKLDLEDLKNKLSARTKIVAMVHVSNFLGTINPIGEIAKVIRAQVSEFSKKRRKSPELLSLNSYPLFLVDGAQAVPHMPVDVKKLGCDFYAFSAHKMYGPMGIGCLWGKRKLLEDMPPFLTGGGMINTVSLRETTFTELPDKFEAGTPNVAGAVGLAAAVKYLQEIGMENVRQHEVELTRYAISKIKNQKSKTQIKIQIFGPTRVEKRGGLIAFTVCLASGKEIHGHDVAQILDSEGIAVRSGHHCVMPLHAKLGLAATTRISFGIYNTEEDIDKLVEALKKIPKIFRY